MDEAAKLLAALLECADRQVVAAIETMVREGSDRALNRVNALDFAAKHGFGEETVIAAFLQAARLGLFEMSWNVLCPGCGGVLEANESLRSMKRDDYACAVCAAGYKPTLDEMVEVTFTVSPRARAIAAHDPDSLPFWEYFRQVFWSSGMDLPENLDEIGQDVCLDFLDLPAGERAVMSLQLPAEFIIVIEPVTHWAQFIDVTGEPTRERQNLAAVFDQSAHPITPSIELRPGHLRLAFDNHAKRRALPSVWVANDKLHDLMGRRRPFLTAKRLFTNQTFRDIYGTNTLDVDQSLRITSLTFLFTDLKGSTPLYDRVGDLNAFDLVRAHFRVLSEIVTAEGGAIVKTIGDAVMATFSTPDRALSAALRMREAIEGLGHQHGDLLLKIGIHEGPCLAVMLNERQDYFGQTVNIAARVQSLTTSRAIFATGSVVSHPQSLPLLERDGITPVAGQYPLRGIGNEVAVYEIP